LVLGHGPQDLRIHLTNTLPVPVSIVIPGLPATLGNPQRNPDGRVRSFTREVAPGATADFVWRNVPPGTYLYHSGSHPALQVQMGLYGALTKDAAPGLAYDGAAFDHQVTLLFSEIDADVHDAVQANEYGSVIKSMIRSAPEYFLINGEAYTPGQAVLPAGQVGKTTLVRLLNACYDTRIPVLNGYRLTLIAEDAREYLYSRNQYAVELPAMKTRDALFVPDQAGTLMLYDRRLGLVNGLAPDGGMYQKLAVNP
jgi:FtsP/CotA-like multicopper oxidase with cupredoxin domain